MRAGSTPARTKEAGTVAYQFKAELWLWEGSGAAWTFITVPEDIADEIDANLSGPGRGFGAVKVQVTVGSTTWTTSAFPSKPHASLILPIKATVRRAEGIEAGQRVVFDLEVIQ